MQIAADRPAILIRVRSRSANAWGARSYTRSDAAVRPSVVAECVPGALPVPPGIFASTYHYGARGRFVTTVAKQFQKIGQGIGPAGFLAIGLARCIDIARADP